MPKVVETPAELIETAERNAEALVEKEAVLA